MGWRAVRTVALRATLRSAIDAVTVRLGYDVVQVGTDVRLRAHRELMRRDEHAAGAKPRAEMERDSRGMPDNAWKLFDAPRLGIVYPETVCGSNP